MTFNRIIAHEFLEGVTVPQGAIWSPLLFNLYIHLLPTVVKHCLIVGYADDHTLLKIIPDKSDRFAAASQMNEDLQAISQFGKTWHIKFAPAKTFSLLISLKHDLLYPPLIMDDIVIPETSSIKVLGFTFDSLFTWEPHISTMLCCAKQRAGQLYRCHSLLSEQDVCTLYTSWIRPILEYGNILYSGAANNHLCRLDNLQSRIERTCSVAFQPLGQRRHAAIMCLVCRLLAGEGRGNLSTYCPQLCGTPILRRSHQLHSYDPAEHLHLVNLCNFKTLDRFKRSWLATATDIWNGLPADIILWGEVSGWHTVLKDIQRYISN